MLIVDLHALQSIDILNLVHEVIGQRLHTQHFQNVVRDARPVDQRVAPADEVAFLHRYVLALLDQVFGLLARLIVLHDDAALGLVVLAEFHPSIALGDDRVILGTPSLEQFRHARQTAGDVTRLAALTRDTRDHVAGLHDGPVVDRQDRVQAPGSNAHRYCYPAG